jgi:predicted O-methyltransferase YrrM
MRFFRYYIVSVSFLLYAYTIGILCKRNRELVYSIAAYFGYAIKKKSNIPEMSVNMLLDEDVPIKIACTDVVNGNVSLYELTVISKIVHKYANDCIFEIGTFDGRTTLNMALNAGDACKVYTLDLPVSLIDQTQQQINKHEKQFINKSHSGSRFLNHAAAKNIIQLLGDSAKFDYTPYLHSCDLVFIDGSHAYAYVHNDTQIARSLIKKSGGIILWHDCGVWNDVTDYLNNLDAQMPNQLVHIKDTSLVMWHILPGV